MTVDQNTFKDPNRVTVVFVDNIISINREVMEVDLTMITSKVPKEVRSLHWWPNQGIGLFEYEDGTNEEFTDDVYVRPFQDAFLAKRREIIEENNKPENLKRSLRIEALQKVNAPLTVNGEEYEVDENLKSEFLELALGERQDNESVFLTDGSLKPVTNQELTNIYKAYTARKRRIQSGLKNTATEIDTGRIRDTTRLSMALTEI